MEIIKGKRFFCLIGSNKSKRNVHSLLILSIILFLQSFEEMCLSVTAVLDVVGSMWCCKFWSIWCASSQRHWVTQRRTRRPWQRRDRESAVLGGDRGLHMNVCIHCDWLLRSLSVPERNFLPVCPFVYLPDDCLLCGCAPLSVCLSVSQSISPFLVCSRMRLRL